jgi:hypothetical protein
VVLLQSQPKKQTRAAIREQYGFAHHQTSYHTNHTHRRALVRSQILRATSARCQVPPAFYMSISQELARQFESGAFLKDGPPKNGETTSRPPNPLTDPAAMDGMMSGMKTQLVMMVPQMVIMGWINFFFQGFVLSESSICVQ